jgi:hypothetical protein
MSKIDTVETHTGTDAQFSLQRAAVASQDETSPDPAGYRTLYVLGFGVLGVILTNTLVFTYFLLFYVACLK